MKKPALNIIKIGGNIVDDANKLQHFLQSFAQLPGNKILVHGGGKIATEMASQLNIPQTLIEGRRITDEHTLRIVTMVYAGLINKNIVALLQSLGSNAIGLSGADGNTVKAHKRVHPSIDYGFAGDVDEVNASFLSQLLLSGMVPVIAPITHDLKGQLLNTNADTMAQEIARGLSESFDVTLIYSFEKKGVLKDPAVEDSVIASLTREEFDKYVSQGIITKGMIPKLQNAFLALESGIQKIIIGPAEELALLLNGGTGTHIHHE